MAVICSYNIIHVMWLVNVMYSVNQIQQTFTIVLVMITNIRIIIDSFVC